MAVHDALAVFNPQEEDWSEYSETLTFYFTAITQPTNVTQLKAFLGLISYYAKFLPDRATKLAPLYQLLLKDTQWEWYDKHNNPLQKLNSYCPLQNC